MKTTLIFILSLFLLTSCSPKITTEMKESTITYQALSRGFYLNIEIQGTKMIVIRERGSLGKEYVLTYMDSKEISELYEKVNLKELGNYKAPTEKRFYDGAAIANLTVNFQGKSYSSQGFDHGNPPLEIAEFINKITTFTAN